MPYLYVLNGRHRHQVFQLKGKGDNGFRIGQAEDAEVRLTDPWISWEHAKVSADGNAFVVEDAGSTNGTYVNCDRIDRHRLVDEDVLFLGRTHVLFVGSDRPPSAPPPRAKDGEAPPNTRDDGGGEGDATGVFRSPFLQEGRIDELEIAAEDALFALPPSAAVFSSISSTDELALASDSRGDVLSDDHIEIDIEELGLGSPIDSRDRASASRDAIRDASTDSGGDLKDAEIRRLRDALAARDAEVQRLRAELTRLKEQYLDL